MATWVINGNTYSDDSTPGTRNLDNDGHRENFPLLCEDIGVVADISGVHESPLEL